MKTHKDLFVWQKPMDMVEAIYELTRNIPQSELYGLTNQIRRCAVSIPSNIAEGAARNSHKEFVQFLYIALGSIAELETQLIIAKRLRFVDVIPCDELDEIKKMLVGLIKNVKARRG